MYNKRSIHCVYCWSSKGVFQRNKKSFTININQTSSSGLHVTKPKHCSVSWQLKKRKKRKGISEVHALIVLGSVDSIKFEIFLSGAICNYCKITILSSTKIYHCLTANWHLLLSQRAAPTEHSYVPWDIK
jgi:hypothetical protein